MFKQLGPGCQRRLWVNSCVRFFFNQSRVLIIQFLPFLLSTPTKWIPLVRQQATESKVKSERFSHLIITVYSVHFWLSSSIYRPVSALQWKPVLRVLSRLSHAAAPGMYYGFFLHARTLLRQTVKIRGSATCSFPVFSLLTHHSTAHSTPFVPTGSLDESCTDADDWTNWTDLHQ